MSSPQEITKQLIEQTKSKKTYEQIVEEHLREGRELEENLDLTAEDMNLQPSQALEDRFEQMLKSDRRAFVNALTKKYSAHLPNLTNTLNINLASWEIVFKWYHGNIWGVSLYGQSIYGNYLTEIDKNDLEQKKIVKLGKAYAAYAETQDDNSKKQNFQKLYDYLGIANLQKLSANFKKLFVDTGFYRKEVIGGEQAVSVLAGKSKGITILAPYRSDAGLHVRMYTKNSRNEVRGFLLGFNLAGKLLFEPCWIISQEGKIILNEKKEKIVEEYESMGALIQARKTYFNFMLETNLPRFLKGFVSPRDFITEKQLDQQIKLWNDQESLSDKKLILSIEKELKNLQAYELSPSPKTNDSSEHPLPQNNCLLM